MTKASQAAAAAGKGGARGKSPSRLARAGAATPSSSARVGRSGSKITGNVGELSAAQETSNGGDRRGGGGGDATGLALGSVATVAAVAAITINAAAATKARGASRPRSSCGTPARAAGEDSAAVTPVTDRRTTRRATREGEGMDGTMKGEAASCQAAAAVADSDCLPVVYPPTSTAAAPEATTPGPVQGAAATRTPSRLGVRRKGMTGGGAVRILVNPQQQPGAAEPEPEQEQAQEQEQEQVCT